MSVIGFVPGPDEAAKVVSWTLRAAHDEPVTFLCWDRHLTGKTAALLWVFVWVRWTVPRFRYDQLMRLGWKKLLPLTLAWLAVTVAGVGILRLVVG